MSVSLDSPLSPTSPVSPVWPSKEKKARAKARAAGQEFLTLFNTTSLLTETDIEAAVSNADYLLAEITGDIDEFVSIVSSVPCLLEFTLCVSSEYGFSLLSSALLERKPNTAEDFLSSLTSKVLNQFSLSFPDPLSSQTCRRRSVELASSALEVLSRLLASGTLSEEHGEQSDGRWAAKSREKTEKRRRRSTVSGRAHSVDVKPILDYGEQVPTSKPQAAQLVAKIIEQQLGILQEYLIAFRDEATIAHFKRTYLPRLGVPHETARPSLLAQPVEEPKASLSESPEFSLFFANAEGFGPWRLSISTRAGRDLRRARKEDAKRFGIIVKKMQQLSNGYFTLDNHKPLIGGDIDVPIYEAKMTRDSRLLYHIHCDLDFESRIERQVLRVFGIYTHAQIDRRFWSAMSKELGSKGAEYRKRCLRRNKVTTRDHAVLPAEFLPMSEEQQQVERSSSSHSSLRKEDKEELHTMLVLEKFVTFSQEYLNNILADIDVAHVFDLSAKEQEIMAHQSSCFVIGRSGTGKTTTMLFKMLAKERSWAEFFQASTAKPRQLFVTQSQVLARNVQEYFARLTQAFATAGLSPKELRMIAATSQTKRADALSSRMVNEDEEIHVDWNGTLPRRYGELKDSDFPMFLTYDHLCRLLEAEYRHLVDANRTSSAHAALLQDILQLRAPSSDSSRALYKRDRRFDFVDFGTFRATYWAHFPGSLKKGLNPELVFSEFLGVIKGSEEALNREDGCLDRGTYCGYVDHTAEEYKVVRRTQSTSPAQRENIYDLFQHYTRMKRGNRQYDAADRSRMLIKCMEIAGAPGKTLNFVYVDEVQDNLLIDTRVLRNLCPNPHGLFWAGDTAQTISAGSAFRFKDLKAFMYHIKESESGSLTAKREQCETFYLTTNYRSHAGIVDCAYSLVEIIGKYWSSSIDSLPQEQGMTAGEKPLFFADGDAAELHIALFKNSDGTSIEYGAHQCILVRNDATRKRLRAEFGAIGRILTIYESKGSEFDDVLLYNPFEDSTVDYCEWRVLLNVVEGQRAPSFDNARYNGICRELKHLYVAITRARMNLWIVDCSQNAEPLRMLWTAKGLINIHIPGAPVPKLAVASDKEEWEDAARSLFSRRIYSEAMLGFERAGLQHERDIALAYHLREQAFSAPVNPRAGTGPSQATAFAEAAKQFMAVARAEQSERRVYYRIAAECYVRSGDDRKAGAAYRAAEEYTLAAQHYRKAGGRGFDDAVEIIKAHKEDVHPEVAQSIVEVSRLHYIRENKLESARQLFEDDNAALEYMDDYGLDAPRSTLLEQLGRFAEAADCHLADGDRLGAIQLLIRDQSQASTVRAVECILEGLWEYLSLCTPEEHWEDPMIADLLGQSEHLDRRWIGDIAWYELQMFRAVYADNVPTLSELGEIFLHQENLAAAVLCLDQVYSHAYALDDAGLEEIRLCFSSFLNFSRALQKITSQPDPCNHSMIQKLLAFRSKTGEMFEVHKQGRLFRLCNDSDTPSMQPTTNGRLVLRWELEPLVKTTLRERLQIRVWDQNEKCHTLRCLQPCVLYAVKGSCPRESRCPQLHVGPDEVASAYNALVRIHTTQIMIFHTLYATDMSSRELFLQQRSWLRRLFEALYPSHVNLGSLHILSHDTLQDLQRARPIMSAWLCDFLNTIDPWEKRPFMGNLMRAMRLAMLFDRRAASGNLQRIPCAIRPRRPRNLICYTDRGERYSVHDLIAVTRRDERGALERGVAFLNHVLERQVPIDIGVLCDFMDHLCGSMLVAICLQKKKSLHMLTLPKSWLSRLADDIEQLRHMRTGQLSGYMDHIPHLLRSVHTGRNAHHLLCESYDLSDLRLSRTRVVYFERLCKNLCLWAHNQSSWQIEDNVVQIIRSIATNKSGDKDRPMISPFTRMPNWYSLEAVAFRSVAESRTDTLILLHHSGHPLSSTSPGLARRVIYSTHDELPAALESEHIGAFSSDRGIFSAEASPIQGRERSSATRQTFKPNALSLRRDGQDFDHELHEEVEETPEEFTHQEKTAATIIAGVYRKYSERKAADKDRLTEMRRGALFDYQSKSKLMPWRDSTYRRLFRLAVPRLVLALDRIRDHLHDAKAIAKAKLPEVSHEELESVQSALDEVSRLFKRACDLHKGLDQAAQIHKACDLTKLRERADAVESLHHRLGCWQHEQEFPWSVDIQLAMALIRRCHS